MRRSSGVSVGLFTAFLDAREALRSFGCWAAAAAAALLDRGVSVVEMEPGVGAVDEEEADVVVATDLARVLVRVLRRRSPP